MDIIFIYELSANQKFDILCERKHIEKSNFYKKYIKVFFFFYIEIKSFLVQNDINTFYNLLVLAMLYELENTTLCLDFNLKVFLFKSISMSTLYQVKAGISLVILSFLSITNNPFCNPSLKLVESVLTNGVRVNTRVNPEFDTVRSKSLWWNKFVKSVNNIIHLIAKFLKFLSSNCMLTIVFVYFTSLFHNT